MDITVYLPDELGKQAREAELKFSRLFRSAVIAALDREAAVARAGEEAQEWELHLEDEEGRGYTGRVHGRRLAIGSGEEEVYLTSDGRLIVYRHPNYWDHGKIQGADADQIAETLKGVLAWDVYISTMHELGMKVVVDL